MNIAERRRLQDGQLSFCVNGREVDGRVATGITIHGELLVAIGIMAILAAVAVPNVGKFIGAGKSEAAASELQALQASEEEAFVGEHLARWVPAFCEEVRNSHSSGFYPGWQT